MRQLVVPVGLGIPKNPQCPVFENPADREEHSRHELLESMTLAPLDRISSRVADRRSKIVVHS